MVHMCTYTLTLCESIFSSDQYFPLSGYQFISLGLGQNNTKEALLYIIMAICLYWKVVDLCLLRGQVGKQYSLVHFLLKKWIPCE